MRYSLYNTYMKKNEQDKRIKLNDLYKVLGKSKNEKLTLDELKKDIDKTIYEKLKDYKKFIVPLNEKNKEQTKDYQIYANKIWNTIVKKSKISFEGHYNIDKFTEDDWDVICGHYEIKDDYTLDYNNVSALTEDEIKALEHAKEQIN